MSTKTQPRNRRKQPELEHMDVNIRIEKFLAKYLECYSLTEAALSVGVAKGSACVIGHSWMQRPDVKLRLARMVNEQMERLQWNADDSMRELIALSMTDMSDIIKHTGDGRISLRQLDELPPEIRRCIKSFKIGTLDMGKDQPQETYVREIVLHDRLAALEMLQKHTGFYKADNEQKGNVISELLDYVRRVGGELPPLQVRD